MSFAHTPNDTLPWLWRLGQYLARLGSRPAQASTGGQNRPADYEVVYRAGGQLEAQVVKGRLESEDIPVLLRYESAGQVFGLSVGALGEVDVLVPVALADRARAILDEESGEDSG